MVKLIVKTFSRLGAITSICSFHLVALQASAAPLNWNQRAASTQGLAWNSTTPPSLTGMPLNWKTTKPNYQVVGDASAGQESGSTSAADPTKLDAPSAIPTNRDPQNPWIVGIGGGARIGSGEPTYPLIYGRLERILDKNVAISLRPRYIFGNSDLQGQSNNEGAFQMPLTFDLKPTFWLSPYLGGGIATNTDSTGKTNGMMSLGADISINRNVAIDLSINYIFQSYTDDNNNRDIEFNTLIYWRF